MANLRRTIENGFGLWGRFVVRRPMLCVVVMLGLAALLASRIPFLEVETSSEDYLFDTDPAKIAYDAFREDFGRDQLIFIAIEPPEVFDIGFLDWLEEIHRDLESSVPHLDEVKSLLNIRSIYGRDDELVVEDLLLERPEDAAGLAALRRRVLGNPTYLNYVISEDGRVAAINVKSFAYSRGDESADSRGSADATIGLGGFEDEVVDSPRRFLSATENGEFSRAVLEVVERHRRDDITIHMTGQPLVAFALTRSMAEDVPRIFGASLALIAVMIFLLFRRFSPVILSATVVVLSLLSTLGLAERLGFPISLPTQILPSFLLAVGVGYVVHFLTIFFRALDQGHDRIEAIDRTLRHVGMPILMTAVTTAAGLVSFVAAEMEQAFQLGITGAIGVFVTFAFVLVFLPAVLAGLPLRPSRAPMRLAFAEVLLAWCARVSTRHPRKIVAATVGLALVSAALIPSLDYSADPMEYFPDDHWLRVGTFYADRKLGGMQSLEVVVDTGVENGLYELEILDRLDAFEDLVARMRNEGELVTRSWSMLEILKETHQALNENRPEFYAIPRDPLLVAQELLLFENTGSLDLEPIVDTQFSKARISVLTGWEDGVEKQRFIDRVAPRIEAVFDEHAEVTLTGAVAMIARTASAASESLIQSYSLALLLITPLMVILIGNLRAGLVSMVPNLVPIGAALAAMVVVGIELDMFTILGACIAIGLAVDDSIHFISGFRRQLARCGDPVEAIERTMESTGRALLFTSIVLVAGFGVLGLSSMANLGYLGLTTAFAIGLAFVLDVTVTPALLLLTHEKSGTARRVGPDGRLVPEAAQ